MTNKESQEAITQFNQLAIALSLDFTNDFLSVERFAEYYGLPGELAVHLIDYGRDLRENQALKGKQEVQA